LVKLRRTEKKLCQFFGPPCTNGKKYDRSFDRNNGRSSNWALSGIPADIPGIYLQLILIFLVRYCWYHLLYWYLRGVI